MNEVGSILLATALVLEGQIFLIGALSGWQIGFGTAAIIAGLWLCAPLILTALPVMGKRTQ